MPHSSERHTHSEHAHGHDADQADLLDLDAEVLGSYLDEVTEWVAQQTAAEPHTVVDLGAGTGTGTLALARRFPAASIVVIDESASMLERLADTASKHGLTGRVRAMQADLDVAFPDVGAVDLAWAASSLHHLDNPDRVLRDVSTAMNPGGLLVVLEMDDQPRFLPDDVGNGLEERCHAAMARTGWNAHPDWRPHLERAGFHVAAQRTFDIEANRASPSTERYARAFLSNVRSGLAEQLDAADLDTLDHLLSDDSAEAVLRRDDLSVRSSRTVWAARRP